MIWHTAPPQPPRSGGMTRGSLVQLRRAISAQSRNLSSLDRQILTSVSRLLSQPIAMLFRESSGLALMKASSTAIGVPFDVVVSADEV